MPRTARRDAPGATHHVLLRGVARCDVFRDDRDRRDFRERLARLLEEEGFRCLGFALMPNHVHLLLQTGVNPLSRLMARLATGYAQQFNRRHDRVGHLFQNRFKSLLVDSQSYALSLVRYVHRNPLEAGLVASLGELERHPWTGLPELLGHRPAALVDVERVLSWFGPSAAGARAALRAWIAADDEVPPHGLEASAAMDRHEDRSPEAVEPCETDAFARLLEQVCREQALDPGLLGAGLRGRKLGEVRARLAYRARKELGLSFVEIERRLGLASGAASRAFNRGRAPRGG